jgi:hypothetical protein
MTSREGEDEYYRAVEEAFVRRRGAAMLLSPRDWSLIGEWKEAGIPLRVVLQGIDNIFDAFERRAPAGRRINSLSYCRQEVLALHELYHVLHAAEAGRPTSVARTAGGGAAVRHLGRLARRVREAMAVASEAGRDRLVGCLAEVAAELKHLRKDIKGGISDPHALEERLRRFDDNLLAATRDALAGSELAGLERAADLALGRAGDRMTPEARERTRRTALAALLRRAVGLPRLTLFD